LRKEKTENSFITNSLRFPKKKVLLLGGFPGFYRESFWSEQHVDECMEHRGMILTGENRSTWKENYHSATVSTTNTTKFDLKSNTLPDVDFAVL